MKRYNWGRDRRLIQVGMWLILAFVIYRWFTPGIPVLRGPSVKPAAYIEGKTLFLHNWRENDPLAHGDGLGPVFNDTSCAACHNQGGVGGGGGNQHNVKTFAVFPPSTESHVITGLVHAHAVRPADQESDQTINQFFPGAVRTGINSTALFGGGWIDRISECAIRFEANRQSLTSLRLEITGESQITPAGKARVLADGRIGRFGWKAQFATLDEFVAAACANEIGLGSHLMQQASTIGRKGAVVEADLDRQQFDALAGFVRGLPRPRIVMPTNVLAVIAAERGQRLFESVGCVTCHVPNMGGVQGIYSDLLLHTIKDAAEDLKVVAGSRGGGGGGYGSGWSLPPVAAAIDAPTESEWRTPPLWGVADSAPYFHDGGSPTLEAAILRHGADAIHVTRRYVALDPAGQVAIVTFLNTLRAPAEPDPTNATPAAALVAAKK